MRIALSVSFLGRMGHMGPCVPYVVILIFARDPKLGGWRMRLDRRRPRLQRRGFLGVKRFRSQGETVFAVSRACELNANG